MLELKNLSITYKSTGQKVIENLSFSVEKGEAVAIMGPSGCGKTTLLNAIQGLKTNIIETTGKIDKERRVVRTIFQEPRLLLWKNVFENIAFGLESKLFSETEIEQKVMAVMKMVGLGDFRGYYPNQLSLGMQQRVNIARAIVCEPDILLLDEPFSSLDTVTKEEVMDGLKKILGNNKLSTVFVTHNLEEANILSKRIIKLNSIFRGSFENFSEPSKAEYLELYE